MFRCPFCSAFWLLYGEKVYPHGPASFAYQKIRVRTVVHFFLLFSLLEAQKLNQTSFLMSYIETK